MKFISPLLFLVSFSFCQAQTPSSNPVNAPAATLADSLFFNMRYKEAAEEYRSFIAKNANASLSAYARMAFSSHFTGNYEEANRYYKIVIDRKPAAGMKPNLYSRMAMTYAMTKNKQKALEYLDSAIANGYANSYEMDHFQDYALIREEPRFKELYKKVYDVAFPCYNRLEARAFDFWIGEWDVFLKVYPYH